MASEEFKNWLRDPIYKPLTVKGGKAQKVYIRVLKNDTFDYLYGQTTFSEDSVIRPFDFVYCGIYNKSDGLIYDSGGEFYRIAPEFESPKDLHEIRAEVTAAVRKLIEDRVSDDRSNLEIEELGGENGNGESYMVFSTESNARKLFIFGKPASSLHFECQYELKEWNEDNLLSYLADKDGFIRAETERYWNENQDVMLLQFQKNDLLRNELHRLESLEDSTVHRIRDIRKAILLSDAQSVTVTVCKDGKELSFRTKTASLTNDPGSCYPPWDIAASDRDKLKNASGGYGHYTPDEITNIEYRGKSIYRAEPPTPEDSEDETDGMAMTM